MSRGFVICKVCGDQITIPDTGSRFPEHGPAQHECKGPKPPRQKPGPKPKKKPEEEE